MADPAAQILLADIGATNARFALLRRGGEIGRVRTLAVAEYPRFTDAVAAFLAGERAPVAGAVLAVAGPVEGGDPLAEVVEGQRSLLCVRVLQGLLPQRTRRITEERLQPAKDTTLTTKDRRLTKEFLRWLQTNSCRMVCSIWPQALVRGSIRSKWPAAGISSRWRSSFSLLARFCLAAT